jgi:hypothetical protein
MAAVANESDRHRAPAESELWLAVQGRIANLTHNWDQNRRYHATYVQRVEGFTEVWGSSVAEHEDDDLHRESSHRRPDECDWTADESGSVQNILATPYPRQRVTLYQYRPAWAEQLSLQIIGIPFTVVNSHYAVWEATGPLPCLLDLQSLDKTTKLSGLDRPPCLVGQRQKPFAVRARSPDGALEDRGGEVANLARAGLSHGNSILRYLQETYLEDLGFLDWDRGLLSDSKKAQALLYVELIRNTLDPCLSVLQLDWRTHEQVYRQQAKRASSFASEDGSTSMLSSWWGWWQVWSERVHIGRQLSRVDMTVDEAICRSREAYRLLEGHLVESHGESGTGFFMGAPEPVLVDILLWDSLAVALSNVHLVAVLADFPALCRYSQYIWNSYFGIGCATGKDDWNVRNARENYRNAFASLPLLSLSCSKAPRDFDNSVELMKHLFLRSHGLHEQLMLAQMQRWEQMRASPPYGCASTPLPFETWHRWRFGDTFMPNPRARSTSERRSSSSQYPDPHHDDKARREYQRHDEFWIVTVLVATVSTVLLFGVTG